MFKVGLTDLAWVILAGELAYVGVLFGRQLGDWQGSFVGALILGLYVSLYAFRLRRPGSIVTLPGIMILVPGVAAYFGLNTLQTSGIIGALPAVAGVFTQIVAIMGVVCCRFNSSAKIKPLIKLSLHVGTHLTGYNDIQK